jgi:transposase
MYPDDLTDNEWQLIQPILEAEKRGPKPKHSKRSMLNAIFYIGRTGCQWRYLPKDYPPWTAVHSQFRRWKQDKTFDLVLEKLRARARKQAGKRILPTAAIVDSQSVKTHEKGALKVSTAARKLKDVNGIC